MGDTAHVAHNTGMIDRSSQSVSHRRGDLQLFAGAPEGSCADISAAPDGFPNRVAGRSAWRMPWQGTFILISCASPAERRAPMLPRPRP